MNLSVPGSLGLRFAQALGEVLGMADTAPGGQSVELSASDSQPCPCGLADHIPITRRRRLVVYINSGRMYARAEHEASGEEGTASYIRSGTEIKLRRAATTTELDAVRQAAGAAGLASSEELFLAGLKLMPEVLAQGSPALREEMAPLLEGLDFAPQAPRKEELN